MLWLSRVGQLCLAFGVMMQEGPQSGSMQMPEVQPRARWVERKGIVQPAVTALHGLCLIFLQVQKGIEKLSDGKKKKRIKNNFNCK